MTRRRYELTDREWGIIQPLLPNKPRGVPRADDRKVLNGILWRFRSGSPWAEIPDRYGPPTTCYNRFVRWRKAGVWDRLLTAVSASFNGELVMIDSTCMRVHQHGAIRPACQCLQCLVGFGHVVELARAAKLLGRGRRTHQ